LLAGPGLRFVAAGNRHGRRRPRRRAGGIDLKTLAGKRLRARGFLA
jgi:hypothetical protein